MCLKLTGRKFIFCLILILSAATLVLQLVKDRIKESTLVGHVDFLSRRATASDKELVKTNGLNFKVTYPAEIERQTSLLGHLFEEALKCLQRSKDTIADYLATNDEYDLWQINDSLPLGQRKREVLEPKCRSDNFLVVLLTTRPINFIHRTTIRLSWGRMETKINRAIMGINSNVSWQTIFTIGFTESTPINRLIQREHDQFDDILRLDYADTYANLVNKTMFTLEWIGKNCPAKFVLKTDDDCFVNIITLIPWLQGLSDDYQYIGRVNYNMPVIRNPKHRNHVSKMDHEEEFYRPYCAGGGYILRGDIVSNVTLKGREIKQIINEDAYIGMLTNALGIKPTNEERFLPFIFNGPPIKRLKTCDYKGQFLVHNVLGRRQLLMHWNSYVMRKFPSVCASFLI